MNGKAAVTGAFGYSGKYIARRLLASGCQVLTLTSRVAPVGDGQISAALASGQLVAKPFHFDQPAVLRASLEGVDTLYNTYWVRFDHGAVTFEKAVQNTLVLLRAAREAGVRRIVHLSITNPSLESPLPYFRGKARLEETIRGSGLSYAILRPTVIFSQEDILINNVAWLLRRFPFFVIPGSGEYRLQPVYVEDLARLAVEAGARIQDQVIDAVGPDSFTFNELVGLLRETVGSKALVVHLPPGLALFLSQIVGALLGDVVLTRDEIAGLSADLLVSVAQPACPARLADWLAANPDAVGRRYASELKRHY